MRRMQYRSYDLLGTCAPSLASLVGKPCVGQVLRWPSALSGELALRGVGASGQLEMQSTTPWQGVRGVEKGCQRCTCVSLAHLPVIVRVLHLYQSCASGSWNMPGCAWSAEGVEHIIARPTGGAVGSGVAV